MSSHLKNVKKPLAFKRHHSTTKAGNGFFFTVQHFSSTTLSALSLLFPLTSSTFSVLPSKAEDENAFFLKPYLSSGSCFYIMREKTTFYTRIKIFIPEGKC